jgi:hypothetical protein
VQRCRNFVRRPTRGIEACVCIVGNTAEQANGIWLTCVIDECSEITPAMWELLTSYATVNTTPTVPQD